MSFRHPIIAALCCLSFMCMPIGTVTAADAPTTAPWQRAQAPAAVIRGDFTQKKYLPELNQPLVSTGHFVVAAKHGLLWQIQQPITAELIVTKDYLLRRSNGRQLERVSTAQQPALRVVTAILLAVFQADMTQLRQYFDVQTQSNGRHWTLTLQPLSKATGQFISSIHIEGAAHIKRIEIRQPGGDRSVITLDVNTTGPSTLTASEQARFEH